MQLVAVVVKHIHGSGCQIMITTPSMWNCV